MYACARTATGFTRRARSSSYPSPGWAAALAKAFKLIESAQRRWRMVNAPHDRP